MLIRIVQRPRGEAPDWVRDAWIGVILDAQHSRPQPWRGLGVLTGPAHVILQIRDILLGRSVVITGYAINARDAIDRLATTQPAAAAWWREHTPHLLRGNRNFVFDAEACERE